MASTTVATLTTSRTKRTTASRRGSIAQRNDRRRNFRKIAKNSRPGARRLGGQNSTLDLCDHCKYTCVHIVGSVLWQLGNPVTPRSRFAAAALAVRLAAVLSQPGFVTEVGYRLLSSSRAPPLGRIVELSVKTQIQGILELWGTKEAAISGAPADSGCQNT